MPNVVVLSDGCSPTEDIYLMRSCASFLAERQYVNFRVIRCKKQPPDKTLFKSAPDLFVAFRTLPQEWIHYLQKNKQSTPLVYVLDDDLSAAEQSPELPDQYRNRIAKFAQTQFEKMLALADTFVVTSSHLIETYNKYNPVRLNPTALSLPGHCADFSKSRISIAYHATSSHKSDLEQIETPLINTLNHFNCSFESLIGKQTPLTLKQHSSVRCKSPKSYSSFRRFQSLATRHICLAPLFETPYNKGKSWIKFLDAAAVGAVGVYSKRAPYTEVVEHGVTGMLATDDPSDWEACLSHLLENPQQAQAMAENALLRAKEVGHAKWSYRFWYKQLNS